MKLSSVSITDVKVFAKLTDPTVIRLLNNGGVGVIPTDTLYGLVARADDPVAFERLYKVRNRTPGKPCIVLAAGVWQIKDTRLWTKLHWLLAEKYWPGPLSIIAPSTESTPAYLAHPETRGVSYRVPNAPELQKLLTQTGLLVAPSANPQNQPPATTLAEAQAYFGESVDFYVDGAILDASPPSTLVTVIDNQIKVLRDGAIQVAEVSERDFT